MVPAQCLSAKGAQDAARERRVHRKNTAPFALFGEITTSG